MSLPTVTIRELSDATQDNTLAPSTKKVVEGLLNDYMDLEYGKETPYTTGQQVIPTGATLDDVEKAAADESAGKNFQDVFQTIEKTAKSGDLTPLSPNDGSWDAKLTPVLVLVTPNP